MKRRKLRKWAKWGFTGAACLMLVVAVLSRFCGCWRVVLSRDGKTVSILGAGAGLASWFEFPAEGPFDHIADSWDVRWSGVEWHWGLSGELATPGSAGDWHA